MLNIGPLGRAAHAFQTLISCSPWVGLTLEIHVELLGGRRPCTRSIHWPDKSAIAERFSGIAEAADDAAPSTPVGINGTWATENGDLDLPDGIDKSVLVIATPRRYGNREHLRYVAQQACLICGRKQSDPHHLRYLQPRALEALGRKASDEFAVPLCRAHHRAVHRASYEQAWWKGAGVDPVKVARQLWQETRNHPQDGHPVALRRARASAMLDAPLSRSAAR
jgi:hypothetical protein